MKKKKYIITLSLCFTLLAPTACDFLDIPLPKDQLVQDNVYTTDQSAIAAVAGVYEGMINASGQLGNLNIALELCADNLAFSGNDNGYVQFFEGNVQENNSYVQNLWTAFYRNIYRCNAVLEGLPAATNVSPELRDQLRGELLALRAFCYFYLINLWEDVPLITGTDYRVNQGLGRTPTTDIQEVMLRDLEEAKGLLTSDYPSSDRGRINLRAVQALLARIYASLENWQEAASLAGDIMSDATYELEGSEDVYKVGSRETIWQLIPYNFPAQAPTHIPGNPGIVPTYYLTPDLIDTFMPDDKRLQAWTGMNTVGEASYYYSRKYRVTTGNNPVTEALVVFRLAELYLIRAEANAILGNEEEALLDLQAVRSRAGLGDIEVQGEALLRAITDERRRELFAEWGFRWLDLRRTGTADDVLGAAKPGWLPTDALWPLPINEMERNPYLVPQNPGY
ncbi:RagB/SusD family nutrient uptake outer membrane protein [Parapedobacter koreensis]|uniref:RagB/SusD domain-containing protein n=1 Tax=Parapedobacter koreensis TaxID=332977 RepID=A0A1H7TXA8_9SPHI|nr:RagB/SusD family nutrient uptake outer membrane protein [Parapedobacter koreensis]SEL89098.1 RagB/SusD domain-containing protein [Parapedobacter koreensis]